MPGTQALSAQRAPAFSFDPQELVLALPSSDPLHDPRVESLPVTAEDVLEAVWRGVPTIEVRKRDDDNIVIDGKQRTKATIVANAIGAGVKYRGPVAAIKTAILELTKDEALVERISTKMGGRAMRIRATAANTGDDRDARLKMRARNSHSHQDELLERIRWAQNESEQYATPVADIAAAEKVSEATVRKWLAMDASKPRTPKARGKAKGPTRKRIGQVAASEHTPLGLAVVLRWTTGVVSDDELARQWPELAAALETTSGRSA